MALHPEATAQEVFLGNVERLTGIPPYLRRLYSIRLGVVAYGLDGKKVPGYAPLIINRSELAECDRIQMARLAAIQKGTL